MLISLLQWLEDERVDHAPFDIDDVERDEVRTAPVATDVGGLTVGVVATIAIRKCGQPRSTRG